MPYVLDKFRAIERTSFLGFGSFLLAMLEYLPCLEFFNPTPIQFIPMWLVPCCKNFSYFACRELRPSFTVV